MSERISNDFNFLDQILCDGARLSEILTELEELLEDNISLSQDLFGGSSPLSLGKSQYIIRFRQNADRLWRETQELKSFYPNSIILAEYMKDISSQYSQIIMYSQQAFPSYNLQSNNKLLPVWNQN